VYNVMVICFVCCYFDFMRGERELNMIVKQDRSAATKILTSTNKTVRSYEFSYYQTKLHELCSLQEGCIRIKFVRSSRIKGEDVTAMSCYDICKP
jgi:hypothetical protein